MREYAGGRPSQSSVARRPSPCTPTLLGTEVVLRCCVCCVVDFCLYAAVFRMEPIWFLYSSIFMVIRWADPVSVFFDTYRNILCQSDISEQDAQSASIPRMFFPVGWKRQPEEGGIGPGCCGGGRPLRAAETALLRQGLLSEPQASSGPYRNAFTTASRRPSSIPDGVPAWRRCHLLWRPSTHPPLKTSKTSPTASTPGAMPPFSGVPQPHPPLKISKTSTTASTPGAMPSSPGVPLYIRLTKSQQHPPRTNATFL